MPDGDVRAWPRVALGEVLRRRELDVIVTPCESYHFAGVQSFGRGVFRGNVKRGSEFSYPRLTRVRAGDVTFPKLMAWEGAIGVVSDECDGLVVSPEFPVFEVDRSRALPRFLDLVLRGESFWPHLSGGSTGTNVRRRRLHPDDFVSIAIPLPPLAEQRRLAERVDALCAKIDEAERLRGDQEPLLGRVWTALAARLMAAIPTDARCSLGDVVSVFGGGTPSKHEPSLWQGTVPWISPKDMKSDVIADSIDHISEEALTRTAAKAIMPGAVLVVTRGMILARTVPVARLAVRAAINQDMKALVPKSDALDTRFLALVLMASGEDILRRVEKSSHDTRKLETERLLGLSIPVPELAAQRVLIERLEAMKGLASQLRSSSDALLGELNLLRSTIIERAVRGEL